MNRQARNVSRRIGDWTITLLLSGEEPPRNPETTVLYQVIAGHCRAFGHFPEWARRPRKMQFV